MRFFNSKSAFLSSVLAMTLVLTSAFPFVTNAANNDIGTPRLNKISQVTSTTVVLPIQLKELKKKNVVASIRIINKSNNQVMIQKENVRLSKTGRAKISAEGLTPNTNYAFKVKIRRESSRSYSDISDSRTATTLN